MLAEDRPQRPGCRFGAAIQDLAVVGFDNIPESEYFWPPLTTVYQNLIDVGSVAVQNLHWLIEAQRKGEPCLMTPTVLTPELVIRESSANLKILQQ